MDAVVDGDAAAGDEQVGELAGQQGAVRDAVAGIVLRPVTGDRDGVVKGTVDVVATEHVAPGKAAAFGDAEVAGDLAEMGGGELRHGAAQLVGGFHDLLAAFHFGEGEVGRVGGVDLADDAIRGAPREQRLTGVDRLEAPGAGFDGSVDVADAAHTKPQPGEDLFELERHPGGGEHVAVAGGVDDHVGEDGEATGLALEDDAANAVAVADRLAGPRVQQQADAGLLAHGVEREAEFLGVEGDGVADAVRAGAPDETPAAVLLDERGIIGAPFAARREVSRAPSGETLGDFLAQSTDHLPAGAIVEGKE